MVDIRTKISEGVSLRKLLQPQGYNPFNSVTLSHELKFARGKVRKTEDSLKRAEGEDSGSFQSRVDAKIAERHDEFANKHKAKKNFSDSHKNHLDTKTAIKSSMATGEPQLHTRSFGAGEEGKFKESFTTFIKAK